MTTKATSKDLLGPEETKEVAVTPQAMPPAMFNDVPSGFGDEVEGSDLYLPRVKLAQAMSPEVTERRLDAGDIFNSLTGEVVGEEFVPILFYKEYIKFNPRKKDEPGFNPALPPGELIWKTKDKNDPRVIAECGFGENGENPTAQAVLNFLCYFPGEDTPIVLGFSKTSFSAGKKLLSLGHLSGKKPFERKYLLDSKTKTNEQGTFYVFDVKPAGAASPEEAQIGYDYWKKFSQRTNDIQSDHDEG